MQKYNQRESRVYRMLVTDMAQLQRSGCKSYHNRPIHLSNYCRLAHSVPKLEKWIQLDRAMGEYV
jgi:hypothetical protein